VRNTETHESSSRICLPTSLKKLEEQRLQAGRLSNLNTHIATILDVDLVLDLRVGIPEVDLAAINFSVLHVRNQMTSGVLFYISHEAKSSTGARNRVAHNLRFLDRAKLLKVAHKVRISQSIVQPANKNLLASTFIRFLWLFLLLSLSLSLEGGLPIARPTPVPKRPVAVSTFLLVIPSLFIALRRPISAMAPFSLSSTATFRAALGVLSLTTACWLAAKLASLSQERVCRFVAVTLAHLNLAVLNHVRLLRAQHDLLQGCQRLLAVLLEGHKGKASTAPRLLVTHYRHIHYLTEFLEVRLHVSLYITQIQGHKTTERDHLPRAEYKTPPTKNLMNLGSPTGSAPRGYYAIAGDSPGPE
jgi:hypothetical protein